ncbi:MAG: DNA helicase PcrA [Demequinaceae bacterium]|nr:DNA helicase PcrA [Demequinaceae bacterium]
MDTRFVEGLNPQQAEAVTHEGPALLIIAGAGSGKTRVLTHRIAHLLASGRARPHEILAITFTNKAASEMRGRVEALVGPEARSMWVSTFHAACMRILRREHDAVGLTSTFSIYDTADSVNLMRLVAKDLNLDPKQFSPKALAARVGRFKDELIGPEEAVRLTESASRFTLEHVAGQAYGPYQARLEAANAVDFDDIILKSVRLFEEHPDIAVKYREQFRHILVDEYQDTNHAQYVLVREFVGMGGAGTGTATASLTVVGDADQSIYAFRGANIRNILEFEQDFPDAHIIRLEQNYRSTQTILSAANAVIANNTERRPKNLWTDAGAGERIVGYAADTEQDEARFIAEEITRLMGEDNRAPSEVAVMYRANAQSRAIEERFIRAEIPYTVVGGTRFYERTEIKDMLAYLAAVANENDDVAVRRIVNTPRRGIGDAAVEGIEAAARAAGVSFGAALRRLDEASRMTARARAAVEGFVALLDDLRALAADNGPAALIDAVADRTGYLAALRASDDPQDASRIENVMELVAVGREYGEENPDGTLTGFLEKVALVADADQVPDADGGGGVVTLMTLHTAKGLEYPVVFLTGLEEGTFPHARSMETPGELEEERRLAYVGLTRAKERLYLSRAEVRSSWGAPQYFPASRFVEEVPGDLVDWRRSEGLDELERARAERLSRRGESWSGIYGTKGVDRATGTLDDRRVPPSPPGSAPGPDLGLGIGDRVSHDQYGLGRVVALEGSGHNAVAKVDFGDLGVKRLLLRFAPVVKL